MEKASISSERRLRKLKSISGSLYQHAVCLVIFVVLFLTLSQPPVHAAASPYREEVLSFQSHNQKLEGTLFVPGTSGQHPAVVLVHGSNSSDREKYRAEAEMFANAGIAAFIYDKRKDGFSTSRGGDRSYQLLSEDVRAAIRVLRSHEAIQPKSVGLWGISEGAWVASLAASQPDSNAAFLITVGAVGVKPVQQQSWQLVNRLHDQGVTADSMVRSISRHGLQLAVSAGLFAEANYDPAPAFAAIQQPVLAIWGSNDRVEPALESSKIIQASLNHARNEHALIHFFPDAGHLLRLTPDGKTQSDQFAPGYAEAMTVWVNQVTAGNAPRSAVIGTTPQQDHLSPDGIGTLSWYHTAWVQVGSALLLLFIFVRYLLRSAAHVMRRRASMHPNRQQGRCKLLLAFSASVTILGFLVYFAFIMSSGAKQLAPLLFDRTLIWCLLQLTSFTALAGTLLLGWSVWRTPAISLQQKPFETTLLLIAGILFIPWALYWQLFIL